MGATGPIDPYPYDRIRYDPSALSQPRSSADGLQRALERAPAATARALEDVGLTVGPEDRLRREPTFRDGDGQEVDLYDAWRRVDRNPFARKELVAILRVFQQSDVR